MAESQVEFETVVADLTAKAFSAFAEDVAKTFDIPVSAGQTGVSTGTIDGLKSAYKKLAAVCSVRGEGPLNDEFHVVFDKDGLFTIAGTFLMQPEDIIRENRETGNEEKVGEIGQALGEVGDLMVRSWDRVFRAEMPGHRHFVQSGTFIGNPWASPQKTIHLTGDKELLIVGFEMTIDQLPPFNCSVLYPKSAFSEPSVEADAATDEQAAAQQGDIEEAPTDPTSADQVAADETPTEESGTEQPAVDQAEPPEQNAAEETNQPQADEVSEAGRGDDKKVVPEDAVQDDDACPEPESDNQKEEKNTAQARSQPVSDAIRRMAQSPPVLPGQFADAGAILTGLTAADVMRTDVVWATAAETVEQLLAKMQQHDTGYLLVGDKAKLEGIVSKSDIQGALSPYLQSMFAKWRTPMDVATLQIKAQWVMTRPVRTVRPDATLATLMQAMSEHGGRCMPVADEQGKVQGTVTVFDIFSALLACTTKVSTTGRVAEAPPLV
jgi:CBS domain-containing protein